jgi:hypothetical protein
MIYENRYGVFNTRTEMEEYEIIKRENEEMG